MENTFVLTRAYVVVVVWALVLWMIVGLWRVSRRRMGPGPALSGSMELLFDANRHAAVQVIMEERTGERDPEDKDGDLPQLQYPR